VRIAARNARFAVKEVDIGMAADIGTLARLPKIVGSASWVKDVCLTARDFGADEALAQGFVSRVLDDKKAAVAEAFRLASFIAEKSPVAVQGTKELLNHARDHTVQESKSGNLSKSWSWLIWALTLGDRFEVYQHLERRGPPDQGLCGRAAVKFAEEEAYLRKAVRAHTHGRKHGMSWAGSMYFLVHINNYDVSTNLTHELVIKPACPCPCLLQTGVASTPHDRHP
jgi:hypothetical protein